MESQQSVSSRTDFELNNHHNHYDKSNISRRSVDWRDSGIVIDEDQQFNSIDAIYDFNTQNNIISQTSCCPLDRIVYDQDDDGDTILHLAVVGCTLDKVRDLIKICHLDAINNMMQTPLHVATMANRPEMVGLLLNSGAKLNVHDRRGNTPLHLACQKGYKEIAVILLDRLSSSSGSNTTFESDSLAVKHYLEMANFDGQTCLHLAASHDRRDIIEILVNNYDADLNCQDSRSGDTIMHKAVTKLNVDLVKFILNLNNKQHCNRADYSGRKPLDTIKILIESNLDKSQLSRLISASILVKDRIKACIEQNGCCTSYTTNEDDEDNRKDDETLDSASSSSDYNDSDSDMN